MPDFRVKFATLRAASVFSLLAAGAAGCDLARGGGRTYDAVPAGAVLLFQGPFSGSVTGTAQVYSSSGAVLLHLEGVSSTSTVRYYVFLESSVGGPSNPAYVTQMKATTGSQNYETGLSASGLAYSRVALRETATWTSTEVAAATLQVAPHLEAGPGFTVQLVF